MSRNAPPTQARARLLGGLALRDIPKDGCEETTSYPANKKNDAQGSDKHYEAMPLNNVYHRIHCVLFFL